MGSAVFKTVSRALVPFWVGSIPMHLRQACRSQFLSAILPCSLPTRVDPGMGWTDRDGVRSRCLQRLNGTSIPDALDHDTEMI